MDLSSVTLPILSKDESNVDYFYFQKIEDPSLNFFKNMISALGPIARYIKGGLDDKENLRGFSKSVDFITERFFSKKVKSRSGL